MNRELKVLHVASFDGNIGDNANHNGSRKQFKQNLSYDLDFTNMEMREFFWNDRKFDERFAELANQFDFVMIGGGNYFELWVDKSCTGTSVDISRDILKKIKSPIIFYGLGCDPGKGTNQSNIDKFRAFLDYTMASDKYLISVRNDGSKETIDKYFGTPYADKVYKVPDGGFFVEVKDYFHPELKKDSQVIGINLAGDMLDIRFPENERSDLAYNDFVEQFCSALNTELNRIDNLHLILFPHIFSDLAILSEILGKIEDRHRRRRVTVAPYLHGPGSEEYIFDLYGKCDLAMGMRFHTNVCNIGLNVPTIGLASYLKIEDLYKELNLEERMIRINQSGFDARLISLIEESLQNKEIIKKQYQDLKNSLLNQIKLFHEIFNKWLQIHF